MYVKEKQNLVGTVLIYIKRTSFLKSNGILLGVKVIGFPMRLFSDFISSVYCTSKFSFFKEKAIYHTWS
jgi:hypothetical protein